MSDSAKKGQFGKQKKVKVNGTEYTLQHPGTMWYLELDDRSKDMNGNIMKSVYIPELINTVVIDPVKDISEYGIGELEALVSEIETFLRE